MVGELLVERRIISLYVLHCALEIQQMLYYRSINLQQARAFLLSVNSGSITLEQCISTCEQFGSEVVDLLLEAEIVSHEDLRTAHGLSNDRTIDGAELLFDQGFVERTQLDIARRCVRMVQDKFIPREQAVKVLASYLNTGTDSEITEVHEVISDDTRRKFPEPEIFDSLAASKKTSWHNPLV